jgi:hypothetical protein
MVQDLDNSSFAVRARAGAELEAIGELALSELEKATKDDAPLEVRERAKTILKKVHAVALPRKLRALRAIEVLEYINTAEARQLLQRMAGGAPAAWETRDAQAACQRLAVKP